ncbi:MAG TPA: hypothetical protein EYG92_04385 [Lutibacter sp.]|nr:hypothetical protein [Lutibacter sp.]
MESNFIHLIFKNKLNKLLFFSFLGILVFIVSRNNGMFWDNVLFASRMGNQLYENSLFNWYMPDSFDPGHPPFLGFILAIAWKIFGHHLWVSHLAMLPFTIGLLYQLHVFVNYYVKDKALVFFAFLLVLVDPTLSAQLVLVNPEVPTLFFFFLAINGILYNKYYIKLIGLFFLSIVSFRSMMLAAGVFLFDFSNYLFLNKEKLKNILTYKFILSYVIGSLPGLLYVSWRLKTKGWLQTHPDSPWVDLWHYASPTEFLRNIVVLGHRYVDFGRIFIFIFIIISLFIFKKKLFTKDIKQLILLAITSVIGIVITSLIATNTMGHRYFISSYLVIILIAFIILNQFYINKKLIYSLLFIGLVTGNLWIYPRNIAQGWDASLAHIPYHNLRQDAIQYLNENDIKIEETVTFFPNSTYIDDVDLQGDKRIFEKYTSVNKYVMYSNVYNLDDEEYDNLDTNYTIIKKFNNLRIHIYIYKLKEK